MSISSSCSVPAHDTKHFDDCLFEARTRRLEASESEQSDLSALEWIEVYLPGMAAFGSSPPVQIDKLRTAINKLDSRVSKIEGRLSAPPPEKKSLGALAVGLICVGAAAVLSFWGWLGITLTSHGNQLAGIAKTQEQRTGELDKISKTLAEQGNRIRELESREGSRRLEAAAANPASERSQAIARNALAEARQRSLPLPESVVRETGKQFIEVSSREPEAWRAVLDFLEYQSTLNVLARPPVGFPRAVEDTRYRFRHPEDKSPAFRQTSFMGVPIERAARYEDIGENLNKDATAGPAWLLAKGGEVLLDGQHLQGVVFEGTVIHYKGGPLILKDVIFINCRFVFPNNVPARRLGQQLLTSSKVTFQA